MTNSIRPLRRRLTVAAVPLLTLLAAAPASAQLTDRPPPTQPHGIVVSSTMTDPDDTSGRLDISLVQDRTVQLDRHHVLLTYRVRTYTTFGSSRLNDTERNFVLELDRDGEPGSERNVRVTSHGGSLVAEVISNATREVIGTVEVSRPNDQAILLLGSRRLIGARSYFWTSNYHSERSPECGDLAGVPLTCQDSVPRRGWIRLNHLAWPGQG
jgi:hypothetical protein